MKRFRKLLSLCCALLLVLGMAPIGNAAGTPTTEGDIIPYGDTNHPYDIAVMTFNILGDNSGTARYDTPAARVDRVVGLIKNYRPDVVNLQEVYVGVYVDEAKTLSWHNALTEKLTEAGYGIVSPANIEGGSAARSSALMIAYKKDRFTAGENGFGSLQVEVTYSGYTSDPAHSQNRFYIWTELFDKNHGNAPIYCFDTHFTSDLPTDNKGNTIPANDNDSGRSTREWLLSRMHGEQAAIVAKAVKSIAGNSPFFIGGDFNTGLEMSYQDKYFSKTYGSLWGTNWNCLLRMTDTYSAIHPAVRVSKRVLNTDIYGTNKGTAWTGIDHIFINNDMTVVTDYQTLMDHVDGRRPSDHLPRIAYCSYRPAMTANVGSYDKWEGVYEHTVSNAAFAPTLTLPAGVTYTLGDQGTSLNLTKYKNTFDIKLYNNGALYATVPATVYNTAATRPTLTVTEAENVYFANHAYHVAVRKDTETLTPAVSGGTLYTDDTCALPVTALTPVAGRTELCLKSDTGELIPVYIYLESATAAAKTVYIEDDTAGAAGTVAFFDGKDVILGTAGDNIFSDFPDVIAKLNDGTFTTAVFAGGEYNGNNSSTLTGTALSANVTLVGNNADIEANLRETKEWKENPERKEETVIHGAFRYRWTAADALINACGFTFVGQADFGSIFADESRGSVNNTTTLNICNNIFRGATYRWNGAAIYVNNAPQKKGTVSGNLFMVEGNLVLSENDNYNYDSLYYRRGIFGRNINGLNIENNRFVGFTMPLWLSGEAASGNTTTAAHASFTVQDNRFERCDHLELYVQNISSATAAHIKLLNNDFLRCGSTGLDTVYLQYVESGVGVDFSKCSLEIKGNSFNECIESLFISRSNNNANAAVMPLSITGNRFIPNDQHNQLRYIGKTVDLKFGLGGEKPANWDLSRNYFSAEYFMESDTVKETNNNYLTPDVHDPALFVNTNGLVTPERALYAPYYADYEMTSLICDHVESDFIVDTPASAGANGAAHTECTICGQTMQEIVLPATGLASINGKTYATLVEALSAAKEGETVLLLADTAADFITVNPGVTLDLNGNTLSAGHAIGFKGSVIGGEGKLIVNKDKVALDKNNGGFLPVYEEDGYIFVNVNLENRTAMISEKQFAFSPVFDVEAHEALLAGSAASGIKVVVRLNWEKADNYKAVQDFTYLDQMVKTVIESYDETKANYGEMFIAEFAGTEAAGAEGVTVSAVIISDTGVEIQGAVTEF